MKKKKIVKIKLQANYYRKGWDITPGQINWFRVTVNPKRLWYDLLLEFVTFGLYKAKWTYKGYLINGK